MKKKKDSEKNNKISSILPGKNTKNTEAIRTIDGIYHFYISVKPNAKQSLIYWDDNHIRADIQSPPDKSKANQELIKLLASILDCSSSQIQILAGHTSHDKHLSVSGLNKQLEEIKMSFGNKK